MDSGIINYHSHTWRCQHASGTEAQYVRRAIDAGYAVMGFSDHSPWPYRSDFVSGMRMRWDQFEDYRRTVLGLRARFAGQIEIPLGLECEAFPEYFGWLGELRDRCLDYVLLGNHYDTSDEGDHARLYPAGGFYFGRCTRAAQVRRYAERTIAGMRTGLFDCLAHPDLFLNTYARFDDDCRAVSRDLCQAANALRMPLEFNLLGFIRQPQARDRGCVGYTSAEFWRIAAREGCTAIVGLDAHSAEVVSRRELWDSAYEILEDLGIRVIYRLPERQKRYLQSCKTCPAQE